MRLKFEENLRLTIDEHHFRMSGHGRKSRTRNTQTLSIQGRGHIHSVDLKLSSLSPTLNCSLRSIGERPSGHLNHQLFDSTQRNSIQVRLPPRWQPERRGFAGELGMAKLLSLFLRCHETCFTFKVLRRWQIIKTRCLWSKECSHVDSVSITFNSNVTKMQQVADTIKRLVHFGKLHKVSDRSKQQSCSVFDLKINFKCKFYFCLPELFLFCQAQLHTILYQHSSQSQDLPTCLPPNSLVQINTVKKSRKMFRPHKAYGGTIIWHNEHNERSSKDMNQIMFAKDRTHQVETKSPLGQKPTVKLNFLKTSHS